MERLISLLQGVDVLSKVPFDVPVQAICADSRRVWPGSAFVAIAGTTLNGNQFIPDAVKNGAAVIISNGSEKAPPDYVQLKTPAVRVHDPRKALSQISANFYDHPSRDMTIIGITGTNGKTTTIFLLHSILKAYNLKSGLIGTLGIRAPGLEAGTVLTTPDCIDLQRILALFRDGGVTHVVLEVSSHALQLSRVADVEFDFAVFTNLTQDHLDFHKTMTDYFNAKAKLFSMLPAKGKAILNSADERFESLKEITAAPVVSYSVGGHSDVSFQEWGMSSQGITGTIAVGSETIAVNSCLVGIHNLENILSAVATAWTMGVSLEAIERGIETCKTIPGRTEQFVTKNGATVVIDYAHTPDAYRKLFASLRSLLGKGGRLWVIFGCGGDRDREKRPLMATAAEEFADKILVVPDNPRTEPVENISADIRSGFQKKTHKFCDHRERAIRDAIARLLPGDILAIVGKGREDYDIVGTEKIPYSDVDAVQNAIDEN